MHLNNFNYTYRIDLNLISKDLQHTNYIGNNRLNSEYWHNKYRNTYQSYYDREQLNVSK